jgi:NAD(P)-dependent dehydrogenase (short-subunit alcohol dehydrogenase family)
MARNIKDLFDMTGRTAIITGGGTHLGTAMATALGQLGASVYLASPTCVRRGSTLRVLVAMQRTRSRLLNL